MAKLWYNGEYKKFKEISPILFGISALILETDKEKFEKLVLSIKMDKEIKEQLERIVMDLNVDDELVTKYYDLEEERRKMNEAILETKKQQFIKEAKEEGIKEGIKEGVLEKEKEVVINMYKENFSNEVISKVTKLSLEEIDKIINDNK